MECKKCGHVWTPVVEKPLKCPLCNQPKYWLAKVRGVVKTPQPVAKIQQTSHKTRDRLGGRSGGARQEFNKEGI